MCITRCPGNGQQLWRSVGFRRKSSRRQGLTPIDAVMHGNPSVPEARSHRMWAARGVIPADNRVLYFGRDREAFRFLSHFHPAAIVLDGEDVGDRRAPLPGPEVPRPGLPLGHPGSVDAGPGQATGRPAGGTPAGLGQVVVPAEWGPAPRRLARGEIGHHAAGRPGQVLATRRPRRLVARHRRRGTGGRLAVRAVLGDRAGRPRAELGWASHHGSPRGLSPSRASPGPNGRTELTGRRPHQSRHMNR